MGIFQSNGLLCQNLSKNHALALLHGIQSDDAEAINEFHYYHALKHLSLEPGASEIFNLCEILLFSGGRA